MWTSCKEQHRERIRRVRMAFCVMAVTVFTVSCAVSTKQRELLNRAWESNALPASPSSDQDVILAARSVVNLLATYQPQNVRRNLAALARRLCEPASSELRHMMPETTIREIENTNRSQQFYIADSKITVEKRSLENRVVVQLPGECVQTVDNKQLSSEQRLYEVTLARRASGDGIAIVGLHLRQGAPAN